MTKQVITDEELLGILDSISDLAEVVESQPDRTLQRKRNKQDKYLKDPHKKVYHKIKAKIVSANNPKYLSKTKHHKISAYLKHEKPKTIIYSPILTLDDIRDIIASNDKQVVLAKKYGVSQPTIARIKNGTRCNYHNFGKDVRMPRRLTEQDVRDIRASSETHEELANIYNVSESHIKNIIERRRWKRVT